MESGARSRWSKHQPSVRRTIVIRKHRKVILRGRGKRKEKDERRREQTREETCSLSLIISSLPFLLIRSLYHFHFLFRCLFLFPFFRSLLLLLLARSLSHSHSLSLSPLTFRKYFGIEKHSSISGARSANFPSNIYL